MSSTKYPGIAVIFSGPSGVGKSTVCKHLYGLMKTRPHFSISCTTRSPRPGEENGVHYHFISPEEFNRHQEAGDFLEFAQVHKNSYGTLRSEVEPFLKAGTDVILDIDVQGAQQIVRNLNGNPLRPYFVTVFLLPPSFEKLEERLRGRNTEKPDQIATRLAGARQELQHWREYDYVLINQENEGEETARQLWAIMQATRSRSILQGEEFWHE